MTKKKTATKPELSEKEKEKKAQLTYKAKLIKEAQKLIGIADVKGNEFYYFVVRDHKLAFITMNNLVKSDVQIMGIQGAKILKGLEEYHWDVYGDAFVYNLPPTLEEKSDVSSTENTNGN